MLKEAAPPIEELTSMRNAVEHPDGYSGKLVVANFTLGADRRIDEPTWHRVAFIPQDKRNPLCPIKWTVTASQRLEDLLAKAENKKPASG
jgi:hypothetical protein